MKTAEESEFRSVVNGIPFWQLLWWVLASERPVLDDEPSSVLSLFLILTCFLSFFLFPPFCPGDDSACFCPREVWLRVFLYRTSADAELCISLHTQIISTSHHSHALHCHAFIWSDTHMPRITVGVFSAAIRGNSMCVEMSYMKSIIFLLYSAVYQCGV